MLLTKQTYVQPSGILSSAKLIIVGEQPGIEEVKHNRPFCGPSGDQLNNILKATDIHREECYVTNVVKDLDLPLKHYFEYKKPTARYGAYYVVSEEGQHYLNFLQDELSKASADVIVAVGNVALYALTSRVGIYKWHGSVLDSTLVSDKIVVPTIHPATVLPPKNVYLNLRLITFDFQKASEIIQNGWHPMERFVKINLNLNEALAYLKNIKENKTPFSYDIELFNNEINCISFSIAENEAVSISLMDDDHTNKYTVADEVKLILAISAILEDQSITVTGQNLGFDCTKMLRTYGLHIPMSKGKVHDTMIAQNIMMPDYPKGLDFITYTYTDLPYYKAEGKSWFKYGGKMEQLLHYNANDSMVCQEAKPKQEKILKRQGNLHIYDETRDVIGPLVYMMERGILVDKDKMIVASLTMQEDIDKLQKELNEFCGEPLNVNSSKQVCTYLYDIKKYPVYKKRGSSSRSSDKDAIKRLIRKGCDEAVLIQEIRKLRKLRSTYVPLDKESNLIKVDRDDRIRCSYNPVGTKFSRLSSSESIFGTGMNMQNWPHSLLPYLLADPYYMIYCLDLSQAENRIVAYYGKVTEMIHAFETGKDVHRLTASLIFDKSYDLISGEDGSSTIGNGTHSERYWGKKANHSLNYDISYKGFAFDQEIPEQQGAMIYGKYHKAYPGIKHIFHASIRQQINFNRTVTNLMGRHTKLLDKLDYKIYKTGYSCIPQGTVGDIINQRGLNYVYYNPQLFNPVELLKQVHDEIMFQIPTPYHPTDPCSWQDHIRMLKLIKSSLETPLHVHKYEFAIPADIQYGISNNKKNPEIKGMVYPFIESHLLRDSQGQIIKDVEGKTTTIKVSITDDKMYEEVLDKTYKELGGLY